MDFGYNDLVWIVSVIVWTTGITAIIMYIIKKEELQGLLKVNIVA
jgi:predicted membrane channel-forming protein YqfA (hemolysin III family)